MDANILKERNRLLLRGIKGLLLTTRVRNLPHDALVCYRSCAGSQFQAPLLELERLTLRLFSASLQVAWLLM
jgi:hypothetical protein